MPIVREKKRERKRGREGEREGCSALLFSFFTEQGGCAMHSLHSLILMHDNGINALC